MLYLSACGLRQGNEKRQRHQNDDRLTRGVIEKFADLFTLFCAKFSSPLSPPRRMYFFRRKGPRNREHSLRVFAWTTKKWRRYILPLFFKNAKIGKFVNKLIYFVPRIYTSGIHNNQPCLSVVLSPTEVRHSVC